jgi:aminoacrylate hydrolase
VVGEGWRPQVDGLADRYTTISFDNRAWARPCSARLHSPWRRTRLTPAIVLIGLRTRLGTRAMRRKAFLELVMPPALLANCDRVQLAEKLRALFGRDLAEQPPIILEQLAAMGKYDASGRLGQLANIPSLVMSAEVDRIALPSFGRELAAAIPGARFVELPGAGHGVPIHDPEVVNARLAEHFAAADSRRDPVP